MIDTGATDPTDESGGDTRSRSEPPTIAANPIDAAAGVSPRATPRRPGDEMTRQRADEERADDDGMTLSAAPPRGS